MRMTTVVEKTAGVVLAGGRSSRMGSPKAALDWHGSTLLRRTVSVVARAVTGPVLVVRAPGQPLPDLPPEVEVAADPREGLGPLQGIAVGLAALSDRADAAFVCSTDLPFLHPAFIGAVLGALTPELDVALPVARGYPQPLAAAYRTSLAPVVASLVAADRLRPAFLFDQCRVLRLDDATLRADPAVAALDPELDSVVNVNESQEYEQARRQPTARGDRPVLRRRREPCGRRSPHGARGDAGRGGGRRVRAPGPPRRRCAQRGADHQGRPPAARRRRHGGVPLGGRRGVTAVPGGYFGRALVVQLDDGSSSVLELPEPVLRAYLGGSGLGTWLMHRLAPTGVDALAPEAPLAFVFSPLVGTPLTTSAKFAVVAKSPLTGMLNDALSSSHFAISGKLTGYDAIVVRGPLRRAVGPAGGRRRSPARRGRGRVGPPGRRGGAGPRRTSGPGLEGRLDRPGR